MAVNERDVILNQKKENGDVDVWYPATHAENVLMESGGTVEETVSGHVGNQVVHVTASERTAWNGKAPQNHASSNPTYGVGDSGKYGHVKLANNLTTTGTGSALDARQGKALKDALDLIKISHEAVCVIGTSTAGHTLNDCDYLCDGVSDDEEINAALNALPSSGGQVLILSGTYQLTNGVEIKKNNTVLRGSGFTTILKPASASSFSIVKCAYDYCVISDLCIDGMQETYTVSRVGIQLYGNHGYIMNNKVTHVKFNGISASTGKGLFVMYNEVLDNNNIGINTSSNDVTVLSNIVSGNYVGMSMEGGTVAYNVCTENQGEGLSFNGNNGVVFGNICNNNGKEGIKSSVVSGCRISENYCSENHDGIVISNSTGSYPSDNVLTGNITVGNTTYGIQYSGHSGCVLGNISSENSYGLHVGSGDNSVVSGNICCQNSVVGISIRGNAITVSGNTCTDNRTGISVVSSYNSFVVGNTSLRGSGLPTDYESSQYTIDVVNGENNTIYDNNILGKNYSSTGGKGNNFLNNRYN